MGTMSNVLNCIVLEAHSLLLLMQCPYSSLVNSDCSNNFVGMRWGIFSLHDYFFSPTARAGIFSAGETPLQEFFFSGKLLLCMSFTN